MVEINLLPWRAMVRAQQTKRKKIFLIYLAVLTAVWLLTRIGLGLIIKNYDATVVNLQEQLTELTSQTQQNHADTSLIIREQIQVNQRELIHLFKALEEEKQSLVTWNTIASQKNHLTLTGSADSISALAKFVAVYNDKNRQLPMNILTVKNDSTNNAVQFRLQLVRSLSPWVSQSKNDN